MSGVIILKTENTSVNNIASQPRLSKGLISKYFDIFGKKGMFKRVNKKIQNYG